MKIAVFGTGGVGGYFGGRLAKAGMDVTFIARGLHLKAIQASGLHVNSDRGQFVIDPAKATDKPEQVGTVDVVLVATKAWQVEDAAHTMKPMIGKNTLVVPLLNGVEAPQQLAEILGQEHVVGGFCRVMSQIDSPGKIRQFGLEPYVAFGELDNHRSQRVERLWQVFNAAHVKAEIPHDIEAEMWQKLLFIASFSGVGAVTRAPAGIIRTMPQPRELLLDAMREVYHVAKARHIGLKEDAVERGMQTIEGLNVMATASMQRDIMNGRASELEAQNGAVVRLGKEVGVETPVHRFIYYSLLPNEMMVRGMTPVGM
ncbi:MAG: 2-dehydropantoate 2-reductase [Anaerolineae bacterium]|nr:2-dehydropantoate 2-reductase [Anaerolineae bacterium]